MSDLIIWGLGNRTKTCFERDLWGDNLLITIVDSNPCSDSYHGIPVVKPCDVKNWEECDYVVVNNQFYMEIVPLLCSYNIPLCKIIITDHVKEEPYNSCFERGLNIIPKIYEMNKLVIKQYVKTNERDLLDDTSIYFSSEQSLYEYNLDYFRYRTFEFVAEIIKKDRIDGALAEFGVFRGLFSSVISSKFPDKNIYLFDTFEGFDKKEAKNELSKGNCNDTFIESHKDTSVERMIRNLPYPDRAIVCKGFFPDSITNAAKNEKYSFVSIDVDFENSTYEGLKFFYPRLTQGGYIFIHDYNTQYLRGVKNAVERYEKDYKLKMKKVPIADRAGTLIITK